MDLFRQPVLGALLRWRHLRLASQLALLALAAIVVLHGLLGPQIAPRNLATVLTSIHWRGLLIVGMLAVGNLFCAGCPMLLARDAGRRLIAPSLRWPRWLRGKWVGLALLVLILFTYELFDLWSLPRATAWLVVGYFALALAVDLAFKGASFCKHVCPIGQFNFAASTMAPAELAVRNAGTCRACQTSDCITGRHTAVEPARLLQRGCELGLFLPAKVGNLDCTLCLDCVRACPHDNIGLMTRVPGAELLETRRRSGIGHLTQRLDLAALAVVFTFASMLNALTMTAPGYAAERYLAGAVGASSEAPALAMLFIGGLVIVPLLLLGGAAAGTRLVVGAAASTIGGIARRNVYALVPLGFGVWLAHYAFHLLTGILTVVPVMQSAAIDAVGWAALGEPLWRWTGLQPGAVFPFQIGAVLLGAAGSFGLVHATAIRDTPGWPGAAAAPWFGVVAVLAAAALWILAQPMDMRGVSIIG